MAIPSAVVYQASRSWTARLPQNKTTTTAPCVPIAATDDAAALASAYADVVEIGRGGTGRVYRGVERASGTPVAIKACRVVPPHGVTDDGPLLRNAVFALLDKGVSLLAKDDFALRKAEQERKALCERRRAAFRFEASMLQRAASHESICALRTVIEDDAAVYIVTELGEDGDLFDAVAKTGPLAESDARRVVFDAVAAIAHLHARGVAHLDVKAENLVLREKKRHKRVGLVDFGSARRFDLDDDEYDERHIEQPPCSTTTTLTYAPPEAFERGEPPTGPEADVWALGLVAFYALTGRHPFDPHARGDTRRTVEAVLRGFDKSPAQRLNAYLRLSPHAKDLLARCLDPDPATRPTVAALLDHPWFFSSSSSTGGGGVVTPL